jgi:YcaO-like protein with predicted kinase domain
MGGYFTYLHRRHAATLALLTSAGQNVGIFDAASDLGIPCYVVIFAESPHEFAKEGHFHGFGRRLDQSIALSRALTEAGHCRVPQITGTREDIAASE